MADLTTAVEIAAKTMYEEQYGAVFKAYRQIFQEWEDAAETTRRRYRAQVTPAINALHEAGLLKENTDG